MPALSSWSHPLLRAGLALVALALGIAITARLALDERRDPGRCPEGMQEVGGRCCGEGQSLVDGACHGQATRCSSAQEPNRDGQCVANHRVVALSGGELFIGNADWDGQGAGERFPRTRVAPFRLDATEVTVAKYAACGGCSPRPGEPGLPVRELSPAEAEAFCRTLGGRLPTGAQWVWAAAGADARRFAWGNSGLVCRRAAFGLEQGPCGEKAGPELAGSRPDGASPEGVLDLAGNVAEWTREPDGSYAARGGSFQSRSAAELKSWAALPGGQKSLYIGFRCAYPP